MHTIRLPPGRTFTWVGKEPATLGRVYVIRPPEGPPWVGQSMPELVAGYIKENKSLCSSSLYRVIRGESKKLRHNGVSVSRVTLDQLNEAIKDGANVVTGRPDLWHIHSVLDELE